jgi:hypothetical protein
MQATELEWRDVIQLAEVVTGVTSGWRRVAVLMGPVRDGCIVSTASHLWADAVASRATGKLFAQSCGRRRVPTLPVLARQ